MDDGTTCTKKENIQSQTLFGVLGRLVTNDHDINAVMYVDCRSNMC